VLTIAALLDQPNAAEAPALRLVGAAPLAALMAAARVELGRKRASSCVAAAPNSALACGSAPQARAERQR
jgi:hypothetical protein